MPPDYSSFVEALRHDWRAAARPEQLPPAGDWVTWIFNAGRGAGKTRAGSEWIRERVEAGTARRIHLVAPTAADARDVLIEGASGLLSVFPKNSRPTYSPSLRRVDFANGAQALLFSGEEFDRLRGPQADTVWIDELNAMGRAQETLDMALLGLRLGKSPRCLITTTPRPTKVYRELLAREGRDVVVTRCSTMANAANLARPFLSQIMQQYAGTRLGRQELEAELLLDVPGALFPIATLEETRVTTAPAALQRIVIGVDPAGSSAEWADCTGIVACGLGHDGHGYVLKDASGKYSPAEWARAVVGLYHELHADRVVVEKNFGGDMVESTLRSLDPSLPIKAITSSRGKILRAEPIGALFEQRRAHLVGNFPALEEQLSNFSASYDRGRDGSPDRLDALVFALTELCLGQSQGGFFRIAALLDHDGAPAVLPRRPDQVFAILMHDAESDSVGILYCSSSQHGTAPAPLVVLDWDLIDAEVALSTAAIFAVHTRVAELATETNARSRGTPLLLDSGPFADALLPRAAVVEVYALTLLGDAILVDSFARLTAARGLVLSGAVRLARIAHEKSVEFRGVTRNHLTAQLEAITATCLAKPPALAAAFALAVIATLQGRDPVALVTDALEAPAPPQPAPFVPSLMLAPGEHVIDGRRVLVDPDGDSPLVPFALPPGRHEVDGKIAIVSGRGLRI